MSWTLEAMLTKHGFTFPERERVSTEAEAVASARRIGYPVALKSASAAILHKTDVGGVALGLGDDEAVRTAYGRIREAVAARVPEAAADGMVVEEMCLGGVEVLIGVDRNPQFGPVIAFGLGGILAEAMGDVSFRALPISRDDAREMVSEIRGQTVLDGLRGQPGASRDLLVELLLRAGAVAEELGDRLGSVDLNPVLVSGAEHTVLDATCRLVERVDPIEQERVPDVSGIGSFFDAASVAVIGASATEGKIGHAIVESLITGGYDGVVYPVNPRHEEIMGLPAHPTVCAIGEPVELAVIAVPLAAIPEIIDGCAACGVRAAVIVAGGGKESGAEGKRIEREILDRARRGGVRLVGPNCIGVFNAANRLDTFFQPHERMLRPPLGKTAVVTQSGTVGAVLLERGESIGLSKFVSFGNRIDVDEADLLTYFKEDPQTEVVALYIEGLADGRGFAQAARAATPRMAIVAYKAARTPRAAVGAVSHTGFLGGTYEPWVGVFRQAGVFACNSVEELFAAAKALALQPPAAGGRVAMLGNGAGPMVQAMDRIGDMGLCLASLEKRTALAMEASFPAHYVIGNPLDVTGSATASDYARGVSLLLDDPSVDVVMPWFVFQDVALGKEIVPRLSEIAAAAAKPIVCGAAGGVYSQRLSAAMEDAGIPVFSTVDGWVAAAAALAHRGQVLRAAKRS